jgi:hypothetical protein
VVLTIAVIVIFAFKMQIAALIARTKRLGARGLETFETHPAQPREEKKGVEDFFRGFDNPLLLEAEELILQDLKQRHIETPEGRERALIRSLASTNIVLHFERVYNAIWASQVSSLRFLNSREDGADSSELVPFYESGKAGYPVWYANHPFQRWLEFLQVFNLVLCRDGRCHITVAGMEFLKYLVASRKPGPPHG